MRKHLQSRGDTGCLQSGSNNIVFSRIDPRKIDYFVAENAKSPFADGTDGDGWTETDDIFGDLPEVDKPLFAPPPPSGLQ